MERRLLKAIINPAMIVSWLAGLISLAGNWFSAPWASRKTLASPWCCRVFTVFFRAASGISRRPESQSERFYRYQRDTERLMIGIVILVVVKPFLMGSFDGSASTSQTFGLLAKG